jgi:hypothetical protein
MYASFVTKKYWARLKTKGKQKTKQNKTKTKQKTKKTGLNL